MHRSDSLISKELRVAAVVGVVVVVVLLKMIQTHQNAKRITILRLQMTTIVVSLRSTHMYVCMYAFVCVCVYAVIYMCLLNYRGFRSSDVANSLA